jgi:hypothetical protein
LVLFGAGKNGAEEEVDGVVAEVMEVSVPDEPSLSSVKESEANFWRRASRSPASEQKLRYLSTILV